MIVVRLDQCVGAARNFSPDWSQKTMTFHSFNCSSIVQWGQQILSTHSLGKCIETSLEHSYVDLGA